MIHFKMSSFSLTVFKFGLKFENILPTLNLNHKIQKKCNTHPNRNFKSKIKNTRLFANCMHNYKKKTHSDTIQKCHPPRKKKNNFSTTKLQLDRKELQPFAFMFDQQKKTKSWPKKTRWPTSVPRVDSTKAKKKRCQLRNRPRDKSCEFFRTVWTIWDSCWFSWAKVGKAVFALSKKLLLSNRRRFS